jgi:myo-inositol-1(or 4)-monophosphatase
VGNFTGEADFLYQREVVAGTPKIYGQLVSILSPYSKAISDAPVDGPSQTTPEQALAEAVSAPKPRKTVRVKKADAAPL